MKARNYKKEYRKYGASKAAKKYRAELNKFNRDKARLATETDSMLLTLVVRLEDS